MKDIAIYGAGGFGKEILCVIHALNAENPRWNIIGFFDDKISLGNHIMGYPVLGGIERLNEYHENLAIVMAIASPAILKQIIGEIQNEQIYFPNIIAPNVLFFDFDSINMGKGNVITFNNRISCNVQIGDFNLINGCCSLGHDVKVGDFNLFQPETRISGECVIGDMNFFGVRSLVLQQIRIGNQTRIGAASMIIRKTKDGHTYFGIPGKTIKQ